MNKDINHRKSLRVDADHSKKLRSKLRKYSAMATPSKEDSKKLTLQPNNRDQTSIFPQIVSISPHPK